MELLVVLGSLASGVVLYVVLGFSRLRDYGILIIIIALLVNLLGLLKLQAQYEPNLLGSSDFIVGRIGSCEKALGAAKCYEKVEYRGFPFRAIRTIYHQEDGELIKRHFFSSAFLNTGSSKGDGFILNITVFGLLVSSVFYVLTRPRY